MVDDNNSDKKEEGLRALFLLTGTDAYLFAAAAMVAKAGGAFRQRLYSGDG